MNKYTLLKTGDIVQNGDKYYNKNANVWQDVCYTDVEAKAEIEDHHAPHCRPAQQPDINIASNALAELIESAAGLIQQLKDWEITGATDIDTRQAIERAEAAIKAADVFTPEGEKLDAIKGIVVDYYKACEIEGIEHAEKRLRNRMLLIKGELSK